MEYGPGVFPLEDDGANKRSAFIPKYQCPLSEKICPIDIPEEIKKKERILDCPLESKGRCAFTVIAENIVR